MAHVENVARHRLHTDLEKSHARSSQIEGNTLGAALLRAAYLCQRHGNINRFWQKHKNADSLRGDIKCLGSKASEAEHGDARAGAYRRPLGSL